MRFLIVGLIFFVGLVPGCGPTCQSTCSRLYAEDQCHIQRPGHTDQEDLRDRCMEECETALKTPGEQGDYDPYTSAGSQSVQLDNEMQAASWMDCIAAQSCERLESGGFCAPVW